MTPQGGTAMKASGGNKIQYSSNGIEQGTELCTFPEIDLLQTKSCYHYGGAPVTVANAKIGSIAMRNGCQVKIVPEASWCDLRQNASGGS